MMLRVATFNLRNSFAADGPNAWDRRRGQVLDLLRYYEWDAVGFQEMTGEQKEAAASALPEYAHEGISRDNDGAGEHCCVFYRKDRFERLDGGTFWLSPTPGVPSKAWDSACIRICTWVLLRERSGGRRLGFVNTHLDHVSEEARAEGAKIIADFVEKRFPGIPAVLTGDFNAAPGERCYGTIAAAMTDTRRAAGSFHVGPSGTFHAFRPEEAWGRLPEIDYIFVSRDVRVLKTRTIADRGDGGYPSDHFPVEAHILIP